MKSSVGRVCTFKSHDAEKKPVRLLYMYAWHSRVRFAIGQMCVFGSWSLIGGFPAVWPKTESSMVPHNN